MKGSINEATPEDWDALRKKHPAMIKSYEDMVAEEQQLGDGGDMVNRPSHYLYGKVECIEAIQESMSPEAFFGYCKGNCIKYLWRYERKGKPLEDLLKAQWYLERLIGSYEGRREGE